MKKPVQHGFIFLVCFLLVACALPASRRPGLSIRLIQPRAGVVVVLPAPDVFFQAEAVAPAGGVTRVIYYADGLVIGEDASPVNLGAFTSSLLHWTPTEPGEYLVQAEALRSDGSAFTAPVRVCVLPASDLPNPLAYSGYGYTGPCEITPPNPDAPEGMEVGLAARAIPASLAYSFECPAALGSTTITFEAVVDDPSDRVVFLTVDYSLPGGSSPAWMDTIHLNWTATSAAGEKIFTGTTSDLSMSLSEQFAGDGGVLAWYARAIGRGGEALAFDGEYTIPVSPCEAAVIGLPMPIVEDATATLTPFPTETTTPTLIPVVPTKPKPGGGGGSKCSDYGSKDKCSAAGCNWDPAKSTCS